MKENVKEIVDQLEQGVKELFTSEAYAEHLRFAAKFHNYSLNNNVLIAMQCPTATYVAGFTAWKKLNRSVKKGEKGIKILAPVPHRFQAVKKDKATGQPILDENGEPETETVAVVRNSFRVAYVFDVSQTEGEPLPESATLAHELTGAVEEYEALFEALKRTSAVPIGFEDIPGSCHGYYHKAEKRIAVCSGMSQEQTVKTAIHEIAHSRLHDPDTSSEETADADKCTCEVQAESVAYTVCQYLGIDTSDYSFGYIAGWSEGKETRELKSSLEVIRNQAHELITDIEKNLADIQAAGQLEAKALA